MSGFFADRFDADGEFYVFDEKADGAEVDGPFPTLERAQEAAAAWNTNSENDERKER